MNSLLHLFVCAALFAASVIPVSALTVITVDPAGETVSLSAAFAKVPAVLNDRYLIYVRHGTYAETALLDNKRTSAEHSITVMGDPDDPPVFDGTGKDKPAIQVQKTAHVTTTGLRFKNYSASLSTILYQSSPYGIIRNCTIKNGMSAVVLSGAEYVHIENNVLSQNKRSGVLLVNTARYAVITGNTLSENIIGLEMAMQWPSSPYSIVSNRFARNKEALKNMPMGSFAITDDTYTGNDAAINDEPFCHVMMPASMKGGSVVTVTNDIFPFSDDTLRLSADIVDESGSNVLSWRSDTVSLRKGELNRTPIEWRIPESASTERYRIAISSAGKRTSTNITYCTVRGNRYSAFVAGNSSMNAIATIEFQPLVRVHRDKYADGKMPFTRIDGQYHDVKAAGMDTVTLWCWWNYIERTPGVYDFSWLDAALVSCRAAGLSAVIGFMNSDHNLPAYLTGETAKDQFGRDMPSTTSDDFAGRNPSQSSMRAFDAYRKLLGAIAVRYRDENAVRAYLFNYGSVEVTYLDRPKETPLFYCYSSMATNDLVGYLRDVRGLSLAAVNDRHAASYSAWSDVGLPKPDMSRDVDLRPSWFDFQQFRAWRVYTNIMQLIDTVRKIDDKRTIIIMNADGRMPSTACEERILERNVIMDITSSESLYTYARFSAFQSIGAGRNRFLCEPQDISVPPQVISSGLYHALAFGASGYQWIGTEMIASGQTNDKRAFASWKDYAESRRYSFDVYNRAKSAIEELSGAEHVFGDVAFVHSLNSWRITGRYWLDEVRFRSNEYVQQIEFLRASEYAPAFIYEDSQKGFGAYKVLVDTGNRAVGERMPEKYAAFVKRGGTYITYASSGQCIAGMKNDKNSTENAVLKAMGISMEVRRSEKNVRAVAKDDTFGIAGAAMTGCFDMMLPSAAAGETLAQFDDGTPALVRFSAGKGTAYVFAGMPAFDSLPTQKCFEAIFSKHGAREVVRMSGGQRASLLKKGTARYLVIYNPEGSAYIDISAGFPPEAKRYTVTDITDNGSTRTLTSESIERGLRCVMEPYELRVLRFTPAP